MTAPTAEAGPVGRAGRWGPWTLTVLLTATFLGQFDFFVVNVAAPSIQHSLQMGPSGLELVVGGYAFAYASGLVTGGRLGDLLGHRRMFIAGMICFAVASLICAAALTPWQLVVARLIQGLAAAQMLPQVLALISQQAADRRRHALAWYGAASGIGSIAGQVLGGLLVEADVAGLSWRLIFLVTVPLAAVAAASARRLLPAPQARRRTAFDLTGVAGCTVALAALLVPISLSSSIGWPVASWLAIVVGLVVAGATWQHEKRLGRRGGDAFADPRFFAAGSFRFGLVANAAFFLYFGSFMLTLTILLQVGLGLRPLMAGLTFAPMGVAFMATALAGSRLIQRFGQGVVSFGTVPVAVGLGTLVGGVVVGDTATGAVLMIIGLGLVGAGNGLVLPSLIGVSLTDVARERSGVASGFLATVQQFASAGGVATLGSLFFALAGGSGGYSAALATTCGASVLLLGIVVVVLHLLRREHQQ